MTPEQLIGIDDQHLIVLGSGPHRLAQATAQAFAAMQQAARRAGHNLQPASSWRGFDRQLAIWNGKWRGERPLLGVEGERLDVATLSDEQRLEAILRWSALPGTSRHHWGTDLDVYDPDRLPEGTPLLLEPWEYEAGGWFADLSLWLQTHMGEFGFFLPYRGRQGTVAYEPWHLSHGPLSRGQRIDRHVLAKRLAMSDIEGKALILARLDEIIERHSAISGEE
ncbi:M15 family metallopeptidase [Aeromonas diversa]|uniref:M15 family metallopeptidase n=1 Tax=Aeromonas diversa TaxID=502790 RepID=UPI0039A1681E